MRSSFQIGKLFGIPVLLHWSFALVIPLFAWIIGSQISLTTDLIANLFGVTIDRSLITSGYIPYILGAIVSIGLFIGVLIHELAHSLIAKRNKIKINSITLLILGGVSSMEETTPDPRVELPMALAGPLTSLALGIISSTLVYVVGNAGVNPPLGGALIFAFGYLGLLNIILFAFNLLPAFPMDGGRVLRAWLAERMPLARATRIAADIGKGFAILFGIFGFLVFNPILIIIAFFIYIGANQESLLVRYNVLLKDLTIGKVMNSPVITVPLTMRVSELIEKMHSTKHLGFPVIDNGHLVGMVTLQDIQKSSPTDREALLVKDVMSRQIITLPPSAPLTDAFKIMSERQIGRVPVVEKDEIVGIVTRTDILKVMELQET
ncbi:MAG: CBS domain-containing protein [Methanomicrobiales archaeon]|nr:CBS domain-containing protein [Methanomicrobiales archaeon]